MKTEPINFEIEVIRGYIIEKLAENQRLLFNELDLQMFVARALEQVYIINEKYAEINESEALRICVKDAITDGKVWDSLSIQPLFLLEMMD